MFITNIHTIPYIETVETTTSRVNILLMTSNDEVYRLVLYNFYHAIAIIIILMYYMYQSASTHTVLDSSTILN